jgi:hypothetical protein
MKWKDKLWSFGKQALHFSINSTADTLNTLGNIACMIGGGAFSLTYALDDSFGVSYYASGNVTGQVDVGFIVPAFNYTHIKGIPFERYLQEDNELSYTLVDYINPSVLLSLSVLTAASGILLSLLGTNLKLWEKSKEDHSYFKNMHDLEIPFPKKEEYFYHSAESIAHSLTIAMISCAAVGATIQLSGFLGSTQKITYPGSSKQKVNSIHYQGPVESILFPLQFLLHQNHTLKLPIINKDELAEIIIRAKAILNATYGGDMIFKSNDVTTLPITISSSAVSITSYLACNFFSEKANRMRNERLLSPTKVTDYKAIR